MRLREVAIRAMVQSTAEAKAIRASKSQTRPAGELANLQLVESVDILRPTISKDISRWNGPARVTDLSALIDGLIGVRWQGRNFQVRVQDCRRSLAFLSVPFLFGGSMSPIDRLRHAAENYHGVLRLGWIRKEGKWITCEANKDFADTLNAGLHVAAVNLQLLCVFSFRIGCKATTLSGVFCDESLILLVAAATISCMELCISCRNTVHQHP